MSLFLSGFLLKGSQKLDCQLLTCLFAADDKGINYFCIETKLLLFLIALGLRLPRFIFADSMPSVPREKYLEMDWRAANKVATWRLFKWRMKVIFMADQVPEERQYALILVVGGDEAYKCWDTLEDSVDDPKKVDQVWDAFEKSFEQSTSFWHFRDAYLGDFRQDPTESTADLDLHIKQTVRGCQ